MSQACRKPLAPRRTPQRGHGRLPQVSAQLWTQCHRTNAALLVKAAADLRGSEAGRAALLGELQQLRGDFMQQHTEYAEQLAAARREASAGPGARRYADGHVDATGPRRRAVLE